ncbi:AAA family ATPase [Streptomyces sp. H10-C2]|uniref:helix-turn-helix transcriptional regulator n=1 Tax=unclassified Streptomyces TaxID=2593676 RepID=UPI0024B91A5C|nr:MULTISPECIES: AAA family ATPase [unclassified Streptomyces]MDJ0346719.1 AAA family ATPase [Streptomyces sp. PH10-H1]MDJ0375163.1 AAA family ATPase [Streptomyces sp. H10-C2]
MELVERAEHNEHLNQLLAECALRKGHVILLDGPSASGRTELLRQVAERAALGGGPVLHASCSRAEQALPYSVLGQLFRSSTVPDSVAAEADELLQRAAPGAAAEGADPEHIGPETAQLLHELVRLLLQLSDKAPVFIGIDDIQHADPRSLDCLLYLARRLGSARILVVLTGNPELPPSHPTFRAELLDQPHAGRILLAPLSEEGTVQLLSGHFDEPTAERLGPEFHACSGGNLPLLHALIEDHTATGGVRKEGYGRAVLRQLRRGDAVLLRTARALAVLGEASSPERTGRLAGVEPQQAAHALRLMTAAGLLRDDGTFRSEIARIGILDDLPPQERAELHGKAAEILYEQGGPATQVARLLVEADRAPQAWAMGLLLEAAEQNLLTGRTEQAVAALETAHRHCPQDSPERASIEAKLVRVRWRSDPAAADRHLESLTEAAEAGALDGCDSVALVRQLLWNGRSEEAADLLEKLRATAMEPHSEAAAELHDTELWLAWTHPTLARRRQPQPGSPRPAESAPAPQQDPWCRPTALLAGALVTGRSHEVAGHAEQILRDGHAVHGDAWAEEPMLLALSVLTSAGRSDSVAAWCDRLLTEPYTPYSPTRLALLSAVRADAAIRLGQLSTAVDHAQLALDHLTPNAWGVAIGLPLGSLVLASTRLGHYDEAAGYLARSVPKAMFQSRYGLYYLLARGHHHLATEHYHAALADFRSCGELMRRWGIDVPGIGPWRTSAAEAWLKLGNREQARRLAYDQLGRPGTTGSEARGTALRLLAATSPAERRPQMLTEALDLFEECGNQYEQTRALADLSDAYYQVGDSRRARMHSRRARHLAGMCGATSLSQSLLSLPDEVEDSPSVAESAAESAALTGSERRVAALAVRGYTNREIAGKLFITPSTVEQHLTRIFRKLDVNSRRDLPVELGVGGGAEVLSSSGGAA